MNQKEAEKLNDMTDRELKIKLILIIDRLSDILANINIKLSEKESNGHSAD